MAIVVQLPEGESRFVTVDPEFFVCSLGEVAGRVRHTLQHAIRCSSNSVEKHETELVELSSAFQDFHLTDEDDVEDVEDVDVDCRVLFQGRDLELEKAARAFLSTMEAGKLCTVRVVFRLLGGKGGFGSLLRSQKGGKKTTNFDAMRDLNGRRIRHVKAVERIKEWLEKKKREDELVNLLTGEGPELPKPTSEADSVDPEYLRKLKRSSASRPTLVSQGLRHLEEERKELTLSTDSCDNSDMGTEEIAKRLRTDADKADGVADDGADWMGAMSALNALSSEDEADQADEASSIGASSSR
mmetsp:Transcript_77332/g.121816  ORF Transcript_77332/g.121816 Transcript_77332/m.121816 type:complete len:299 (-) Transcript_77332:198-1094(-)